MSEYDRKNDALIEILIKEVQDMRQELKDHMIKEASEISDIKEAFATAKHVVWFIRWAAGIGAAVFLGWAFLKEHFTIGIK